MELALSSQQQRQLLDWAAEAAPKECCGLLFGENGVVERLELATNVATDPTMNFELDPKSLIGAEKAARAGTLPILGYFHSHPNGDCSPSATDAAQASPDGRIWLIVASEEMTAWQAVENGRIHGRFQPVPVLTTIEAGA
jgi:proteasome lid subunit RPN8/RPN11